VARVGAEVVGEAERDDLAQLDDEGLRIGLRRDVRHRIRRLDGDHAGALVHARRHLLQHRHLGALAVGAEHRHQDRRERHAGGEQSD
jgi:hypothetical protein